MTLRRHVLPPIGHSFTHAYTRFVTESPTLTSLAKAGGCAAKYPAARLEKLLAGFVPVDSAELLVGLDPADDAAVYRLDDERALVFTVDFFPPVVDDPRDFGAIAATNALNDVFAMGGVPLLALSITAFPEELPTEMLGEILAGADEVVRAAGAILAGGHTIRDDEPKYGLAVVGTVHPDGIWPKSGARPGDALFLTKPLGTGLVLQAQREGRAPAGALDAAVAAMRTLNRDAADALRPFAPNAVTDVTGFGLLGHAYEMASRSGVRIELDAAALPALPSALELAEAGVRTGGDRRNRDYSGPHVESTATDAQEALAFDPQTAGGLLVSLPADKAAVLAATFAAAGLPLHRIGRVAAGDGRAASADRLEPKSPYTRSGAHEGASRLAPRGHAAAVSPPRARRSVHALRRRHRGRVRPAHRLGPRLRQLAALRRQARSREGRPRASIEFSNRLVALVGIALARVIAWLAARRGRRALRAGCAASALGALLGTLAQIPLGGLTILLDLHPLAVMSHFLLALVVLALAVARRRSRRGATRAGARRRSARPGSGTSSLWAGLPLAAALVATGRRRDGIGAASGVEQGLARLGIADHRHRLRARARRPRSSASASSSSASSGCSARDAPIRASSRLWLGAARSCSSRR